MSDTLLAMEGITKVFPGVRANDGVSFDLQPGEIHALVGENGAGKTTLMNILFGYYTCDEGEIFIKGKKAELSSPKNAISRGVGMIHQHFALIRSKLQRCQYTILRQVAHTDQVRY